MNPRSKTRFVAALLTLCMVLQLAPLAAASLSDVANHWAKEAVERWNTKGIIKGYPDGTIRPDGFITRAEFSALINRTLGFANAKPAGFTDVKADDWFKEDLDKAKTTGYMLGYPDNTVKPQNYITRQEVSLVFARLLGFSQDVEDYPFIDDDQIPDWSRWGVMACAQKGLIVGYPDNSFRPEANMTRAEVVTVLDRLFKEVYNEPGIYGITAVTEIDGNVVVTSAGITLQNMRIKGDLLIAQAVRDGDVSLKNVTVEGKTYVSGGGADSIIFEDCNLGTVSIKKDGTIRIEAVGSTTALELIVNGGNIVLVNMATGNAFKNIVIPEGVSPDTKVELRGNFLNVLVNSQVDIVVNSGSFISSMVLDAPVNIKGTSNIGSLNVNVNGSTMDARPMNLNLGTNITATINGVLVKDETIAPSKKPTITAFGNEFKIDKATEWNKGSLNNGKLLVDSKKGGGSIILRDGVTEATYTSADIIIQPFEYLVMSWNADTPEGSWVEVTASVWLDKHEKWSNYISWGKWSPFIKRASLSYASGVSPHVGIAQDEFYVRGNPAEGDTASKIRLKVILHRDNATIESPVLWYLHGTVKNTAEDELTKVFRDDLGDITDYECEVEVPQYSQMIRSPNIGGVICNPTTTAMLLNSVSAMEGQPLNVLPEEIAMGCYDFRATNFGSWSFVVATAGTYGYKSYVEYSTIEGIKRHLKNGYAVGCSVHYSNDPTKSDYLENAYGSTGGHLIVLRGYTEIDGVEYFISNDAFNPSNDTVRKLYRIDQFVNCWTNNTIYVVKPGKVQGVGKYPVERVHCDLVEVEPDKYALVSDSTQFVTPHSELNSRHGFIGYITEPEVFTGANPSTYDYINMSDILDGLIPLSYDQLSDEDFKLYVANNNDHPGKLFIVDNQSDINLLVLATVSATEYIVTEDEIKPNTSGITAGTTTVAEFLANLTPAKLATMKLFSASDVVESAADFLATDGKTAGDTIDEGDFLAVLAWDNQTLGKYDIVTGPALEPLYLSFDFTGKELQDGVVTLYIHDFPFESPLEGLPGDYSGDITWTSSNPNLVPVDENGILLEPYNRTTVTITANVPTDGKYQAATISYQVTIGCLTLNSFHWGTINHPVIGEEPSSVFVQHPDDKAPDGTPYKLFWINGGYPKFTWSGTLDENGKFKAGEQYTLQIEFWTNEFEGGNSGYLYKTGFGAADVIGLPPVGTAVGDTSITGVTVNRINSYRVTVTFEYAPLKFKVLGYYSDETCTVDLTTTTPVTLGTTKEDALAALPAAGYAKLSDGTALAIDIAWSFVEDEYDPGTAGTYPVTAEITRQDGGSLDDIIVLELTGEIEVTE